METKEVMKILEQSDALLSGHFELRSGLHSDRYFQCANALRYPDLAAKLCAALSEKIRVGMPDGLSGAAVIAPAMGGIIVGHELARALGARSIFAEKQDGALALRRFRIEAGERFIVAEDVITRGGRVQETIDIVKNAGGKVVAIATLVDRSGGKARFDYPAFSLIEIEPVTYESDNCPLCGRGMPLTHPGS